MLGAKQQRAHSDSLQIGRFVTLMFHLKPFLVEYEVFLKNVSLGCSSYHPSIQFPVCVLRPHVSCPCRQGQTQHCLVKAPPPAPALNSCLAFPLLLLLILGRLQCIFCLKNIMFV